MSKSTSKQSQSPELDPVGTLHHDGGVINNNDAQYQFKKIDANSYKAEPLTTKETKHIIGELTPVSLVEHTNKILQQQKQPSPPPPRTISPTATTITNSTSNSNASAQSTSSAHYYVTTTSTTPSKTLKIDITPSDDTIQPIIQPVIQQTVLPIPVLQPATMPVQYVQPVQQYTPNVNEQSLMYNTIPQPPYYTQPQPVESVDNGTSLHSVAHLIRDNNNVVVKFLPTTFTQENLQTLCDTFGTILSCRLIRDRNTGVSLGYGFVTFDNDVAANKAVNALNGLPIDNKILRAALARPITPAQIQNNNFTYNSRYKQNIYVAGLPRSYTVDDLNKLFGKFGIITESRILLDRMGQSRGVGFVRYTENDSAAQAIQQLNSTQLQSSDELLVVRYARDSSSIPSRGNEHSVYNMQDTQYLQSSDKQWQTPYTQTHSNQPNNTTNATVFNFTHANDTYDDAPQYQQPPYYTQPQPVYTQITSPTYPNTPTSLLARQVAQAVTMTPAVTPSHALRQQDTYDDTINTVSPRLEARRQFDRTGVSLFVFHLPSDMTDAELHQLFSTAGPVLSAKIMMNADIGQSKGYGFVNFATVEAAHHAITRFNGKKLGGKFLKVSLKQRR